MPRSGKKNNDSAKKGRVAPEEDDLEEDDEEEEEQRAARARSRSRARSVTRRKKTRSRSRSRSRSGRETESPSPPRPSMAPNRATSSRSSPTRKAARATKSRRNARAASANDADTGEEEDSVAPDARRGAFGRNQTLDTENYLRIIHIDVSQGESTLVIYGSRAIKYAALIDGGHAQYVAAIVATLKAYQVKELDLILTHSDSDHIEGLTALLNAPEAARAGVKINNVYHRGAYSSEQKDQLFAKAIKDSSVPERVARKGMKFHAPANGDATAAAASASSGPAQSPRMRHGREPFVFECLYATDRESMRDNNDCSIMMKISFGKFTYYTGGDQISLNEDSIFCKVKKDSASSNDTSDGTITAFKCSHHGSKKSTSDKFLNAIAPEVAFISAGSASFCHPDYDVLQRLNRCGSLQAVYLTNCFYNRPQVNPDYAEQEVALESQYLSAVMRHSECSAEVRTRLNSFIAENNRDGTLGIFRRLLDGIVDDEDEDEDDDEGSLMATGGRAAPPAAAAASSSTSRSTMNQFIRTVRAAATAMEIYDVHGENDDARKMHVAGGQAYLGNVELYVKNDGEYFIGFCDDDAWTVQDSTGQTVVRPEPTARNIARPANHPFGRFDQLTMKSGEARPALPLDKRSVRANNHVSAANDADVAQQVITQQKNRERRRRRAAKLAAETAAARAAADKGNDSGSEPPAMTD